MATHVKVVGALFLAFGAIWALAAVFSRLILTFVAHLIATSGDPDAAVGATILGFAGIAVTTICGLLAVAYLSTGWGVLKLRPWGRILGIVMAAVSLVKFPFGTALGIYALVILFKKDTEALFAGSVAPVNT